MSDNASGYVVHFIEVGRDRKSWSVNVDRLPFGEWIAKEAKRGGGLISRDIGVGGSTTEGIIYAGMHTVGHYRIEPAPEAGFTLTELCIVVVIIGLLAAIAVPNFIAMQDRAREASVKSNMHSFQLAAEDWAVQMDGMYANHAAEIVCERHWVQPSGQPGDAAVADPGYDGEVLKLPNPFRGGESSQHVSWDDRESMTDAPEAVPGCISYADRDAQAYNIKGQGKSNPLSLVLSGGE